MTDYKITVGSESAKLVLSPTSLCRVLDGGMEGFDFPESSVTVRKSAFFDGGHTGERYVKPRRLAITFEITDKSREAEVRDIAMQLANPHNDCIITVTMRGRTRQIRAIPFGSSEYIRKNFTSPPAVRLCFIAENPFFESVMPTRFVLPVSVPVLTFPVSSMNGAGTVTGISAFLHGASVVNRGDLECGFTATLYASDGKVVRPGLILDDHVLKLKCDLEAGQRADFDTRNGMKSVSIDGEKKTVFDRNSEFFSLSPGENLLRLTAVSGIKYLAAEIEFCERFLGI